MDVTVVVTPRERFSQLPESLKSVFSTIPDTVRVIVNDGGAPEVIRSQIKALQSQRAFEHIAPEKFILPPVARNMALATIETEYVVYVDNDVKHDPNWLQALVQKADETGAAAVCPISLLGPLPQRVIHHAGSKITCYVDDEGYNRLSSEHRLEHVKLDDARANNWNGISEENDEFEYHCALIRTSVMREIGGHDERQTHYDHMNDALQIKALGHKIFLAPDSVVEYQAITPFEEYDWPYFMWRWSFANSTSSAEQIAEAFGVWKNRPGGELNFVRKHRRRAVGIGFPKWKKRIRPTRLSLFLFSRELKKRMAMASNDPQKANPFKSPVHGPAGLVKAGIKGARTLRAAPLAQDATE